MTSFKRYAMQFSNILLKLLATLSYVNSVILVRLLLYGPTVRFQLNNCKQQQLGFWIVEWFQAWWGSAGFRISYIQCHVVDIWRTSGRRRRGIAVGVACQTVNSRWLWETATSWSRGCVTRVDCAATSSPTSPAYIEDSSIRDDVWNALTTTTSSSSNTTTERAYCKRLFALNE